MRQQAEEYLDLLRELIALQKKLISAFEAVVKIEPPAYLDEHYKLIIRSTRTIEEILEELWFDYLPLVPPMWSWLKPAVGVIELQEQSWLFRLHDSNEIAFRKLPLDLALTTLEALKAGKTDVLSVISKEIWHTLPCVDVTYLRGGRTDGVRPWAVYLYAQTVQSSFGWLDQDKHKEFLKELVQEGILEESHGGDRPHYVFAKEVM